MTSGTLAIGEPFQRRGECDAGAGRLASTTKSAMRAWRPGAQNCNTSIAPVR